MFTLGNYCCFDLQGESVRVVMKTHRFWYVLKGMRASALQKQNSKMWLSFSCNNINNNLILITIIQNIIIVVIL